MLLTGERNGYCSDMHSLLVLDLGNGVQHKTMAQRGVPRPKGSIKLTEIHCWFIVCTGVSCTSEIAWQIASLVVMTTSICFNY